MGYHFVSWDDGNNDNPRTLVLMGDSNLTAIFAINTYTLSAQPNDTAMGVVKGSGIYTYHEQVVLTATANPHYHFISWDDGNTQNPRIAVVSADANFVAQFVEDDKFNISVISTDANAGTTTGSGQYYVGSQNYISANPDEHHLFYRWTDGNVDNPRFITVLDNTTYIACFEPKKYEISVFPNNETMGSVSGGGTFSYGTYINICAYPSLGHHFVSWNDGEVSETRTIMVEDAAVYIAEFAEGVAVEEAEHGDSKIKIWPNPSRDILHVYVSDRKYTKAAEIQIVDIYGRLLHRTVMASEITDIDLSGYADGMYLIRICAEGHIIGMSKVMKE